MFLNKNETTGNDVPVREQRRYCEDQIYMIMNSYLLIPGWNLCIHYVKFVLEAPDAKTFIRALLICGSASILADPFGGAFIR